MNSVTQRFDQSERKLKVRWFVYSHTYMLQYRLYQSQRSHVNFVIIFFRLIWQYFALYKIHLRVVKIQTFYPFNLFLCFTFFYLKKEEELVKKVESEKEELSIQVKERENDVEKLKQVIEEAKQDVKETKQELKQVEEKFMFVCSLLKFYFYH